MSWEASVDDAFLKSFQSSSRDSTIKRRSGGKVTSERVGRASRQTALASVVPSNAALEERFRKAASKGDFTTVSDCISRGVNVNSPDSMQRRAVHFASCAGHIDVLQYLILHSANVNVKDQRGNSPLHLAACTSHTAIITLLIRAGADIFGRDGLGKTPAHYALSHLRLIQRAHSKQGSSYRGKLLEVAELFKEYMFAQAKAQRRKAARAITHGESATPVSSEQQGIDGEDDPLAALCNLTSKLSIGADDADEAQLSELESTLEGLITMSISSLDDPAQQR
eukprot:m.73736 g.73736  ORF g.73736 m.73736 type:complete len:281 (+) comp12373_c0_seq8:185-1027(+)